MHAKLSHSPSCFGVQYHFIFLLVVCILTRPTGSSKHGTTCKNIQQYYKPKHLIRYMQLQKYLSFPKYLFRVSWFTSDKLPNYPNTLLSNFCSIICQVVPYGRFKTKENFRLLELSKSGRTDLETFGILEYWSVRRGGCYRRFDCTCYSLFYLLEVKSSKFLRPAVQDLYALVDQINLIFCQPRMFPILFMILPC